MKVERWLQAAKQLPSKKHMGSAALEEDGRIQPMMLNQMHSNLNTNKGWSKLDKPRATQQQLDRISRYNVAPSTEGGNMTPVISPQVCGTRHTISSLKNAPSYNGECIARAPAATRLLSTAMTTAPSKTPRARKARAEHRDAEPEISSGSRFYSYVIEKYRRKSIRAAPKGTCDGPPCYTPASSPVDIRG